MNRNAKRKSSFYPRKILPRKYFVSAFSALVFISLLRLNKFPRNDVNPLSSDTDVEKSDPKSSTQSKEPSENALDNQIVKISILGERHSGTTWIREHLKDCFEPHLKIHRRLTRYKHWFQYDDNLEHGKTLVLSLFRNPHHWIEAMRKIPHHASNHIHLNWTEFVTKEWNMPRIGNDLNVTNYKERICQEKFKYNEVNSCNKYPYPDGYFKKRPVYSAHQPLYELNINGSGVPYSNILELRTAKIKNFFEVIPKLYYVYDFWPFQYEKLLMNGTGQLLYDIEKATGIKANCKPFDPSFRKQRVLKREFVEWVNEHLDWEVEKWIGYDKMSIGGILNEQ